MTVTYFVARIPSDPSHYLVPLPLLPGRREACVAQRQWRARPRPSEPFQPSSSPRPAALPASSLRRGQCARHCPCGARAAGLCFCILAHIDM